MKKRLLSLLLTGTMVACMLVGCGENDDNSNNKEQEINKEQDDKEQEINKEQDDKEQERITITWLPQCDAPVDEDSPLIAKLEEEFNVDLEFMYIERSEMNSVLPTRLASGEIPDVMRVQDASLYQQYIEQGIICEIPEEILMTTGKTLYEETLKNGGEYIWEYAKRDGKIYGLPLISIGNKYVWPPIWRTDWLNNVGIDKIPTTLEEAEDAFYAFTNDDPDGNGENDTYGLSINGFRVIYGAFGVQDRIWQEVDGEVVYSSVRPEMKEALMLLNKWYEDGIIDPEFITGENQGQYWANSVTFWNGKIGFTAPGAYYHVNSPTDKLGPSVNYTGFYGVQPEDATYAEGGALIGPDGEGGSTKNPVFSNNFLVIGKQVADDPEKLEKIIEINSRLLEDLDLYATALKGLEGEHHEIVDGSYTVTIDGDTQKALGFGNNGIGYILGNNFEYAKELTVDKYAYAEEKATFNGYETVIIGALPSQAEYLGDINAKINEATILFITGEKSFDEWDAYVEGLNDIGLDILTEEANAWYDQYCK